MSLSVDELVVADPAEAWEMAGFEVGPADRCRVGEVGIRLVGRESGVGIVGWSLGGLPADSPPHVDGIPTATSDFEAESAGAHANGVVAIDHVVLLSPDLVRTVAALSEIGAAPRRERDAELGGRPIRQIFFRFGEVIVELVGSPGVAGDGPSTLWGITFTVADIDATAAFLGERTTPVKDAVQPGRRITTLRHRDFGMSVRTAFISSPILGT
ncbi:glyoxalase [Mycolicibacterium sp. BiH015]|uniref:VOC family protein n=1 Tax=Mycolicibacterium sp. BiH015 TaxID=3018808 RepID=UPI0022E6A7EE|nr:VOC family protein [Mycolicibacterium sp. BiH015]MDA2894175.1 glyoxalase [Mycolicibacterium sp. BiH015]